MQVDSNRRIPEAQEVYRRELQQEKNPPRHEYTKEERDNEADARLLAKANKAVTKPITRLVKLNPGGRPKKYTPTKLRNAINCYFAHCEKKDKIPSMKGMYLYLKMTQATFYNYLKDDRFEPILQQARMIIADWLETDIYTSKGQTSGKIAYMQNLHNWANKTEVETNQRDLTVEEARAKIEMLAPVLLDIMKTNPTLLNNLLPSGPVIDVEAESVRPSQLLRESTELGE